MNSQIILAKNINLDRDYINVLNYTEQQMLALCREKQVASSNNFSFIRTQGTIWVDFNYSDCLQSNYIAFQNPDYSNKWFFAFIDDVIYKGNKNVEIKYTIDAWSTWFSLVNLKKCFIVRQHVLDDTIGLHTIPENLDIGQIIADREYTSNIIGAESYFYFVISCNYDPTNNTRHAGVGVYADYPQGTMWFAWLVNRTSYSTTIDEISQWIQDVTSAAHSADITGMYAMPYQAFNLVGDIDATTHKVLTGGGRKLQETEVFLKSSYRQFTDFTPKNRKMFCLSLFILPCNK